MRINTKRASLVTHEGARARHISVLAQLRRSVLSCLLWESEFYEDGEEIGKRIAELTAQCLPEDVAALAIEAREQMHLRHVPLLLLRELARHPLIKDRPQLLSKTMGKVLQRADEPAELHEDKEFGPVILIESIEITGNTATETEIIRRALPIMSSSS